MDRISEIAELLENNELDKAAAALAQEITENGFNDTAAIFLATVNAGFEDMDNYISVVERGLDYNRTNYELWMMRGDYYSDNNIPFALDSYELSLEHCENIIGKESKDYLFIKEKYDNYKALYTKEILEYINSSPILIYKSEEICYGILNYFSDLMAEYLRGLGETVEIIDVNTVSPTSLPRVCKTRYKAILGIQSYLFSIKYNDTSNMHDTILGPKYNMVFDHVACMYNHIKNAPRKYHILTHDRNYLEFTKKYFKKSVYLLPPGGEKLNKDYEKKYDLIFLGSYKSCNTWDNVIAKLDSKYGNSATALISHMMTYPNKTYEEALRDVLGENAELEVFFDLKETYFYVMSYFRERIILEILRAGIELNVFGGSWNTDIFKDFSNLIINPEVSPRESIDLYAKSYASLNIMSWHKDGRTERVANSMLNHSLVISDKTRYLQETYRDGEDIILFDLENIEVLPQRIKEALQDKSKLRQMAEFAYKKAGAVDTWEIRAEEFKRLNDNIINKEYGYE